MFSLFPIHIESTLLFSVLVAFTLGALLLFIKISGTEYVRRLARTKALLTVNMFVTSFLFYVAFINSNLDDFSHFASLVILVITDLATLFLSYALINLLEEKRLDRDKHYLSVFVKVILDYFLLKSFFWPDGAWKITFQLTCVVIFIIECILHIIIFDKAYKSTKGKLENCTDEDAQRKIHWIRFCYIIMMITQMFVLVYIFLPGDLIMIYALLYSLYMIYFTANFISFIGSHKLLMDAFAYKALSFQDYTKPKVKKIEATDPMFNEASFAKIEKYLDLWVKDKKFRECDKTREEVAKDLHTTKDGLQMYFNVKKNIDFRTWRTELRVQDAKHILLENTDLSIQSVGEMAGFSDRSNFHRQFTKIVGCSPKTWRDTKGKFKA